MSRAPPFCQSLLSPLRRIWETIKTDWREAKEQADPVHEERAKIAWDAVWCRISHDEAFRRLDEVGTREWWLKRTLPPGDGPSATDAPGNG